MNVKALNKHIDQIQKNDAGEPDLYSYVKDILTKLPAGPGLKTNQVVIDSRIDDSLRRPDLVAYKTVDGKPQKSPDYAYAVFEVKPGSKVRDGTGAIFNLKRAYIQPGTRWFYLIDQTFVRRVDCASREKFTHIDWDWDALRDPDTFARCFGELSAEALKLERDLEAFKDGETPYSYLKAEGDGRAAFAETIREASELLRRAIQHIIDGQVKEDLKDAKAALDKLRPIYGEPRFFWQDERRPVDFERVLNTKEAERLTEAQILEYEPAHAALLSDIRPRLYALRIEHQLLHQYAERQGLESAPSLLDVDSSSEKKRDVARRMVDSLVYETAALILSRMLMIRFCEDHELFVKRYISNGGVEVFWHYARHFDKPMQELLRTTYEASAEIFRSLFDPSVLDWAIERSDDVLSDGLTRAAFILSRWDFRSVHGDILSGVYDKYLDVSQRRRLGEVYTRPEIARFMLEAAGWKPGDTVLDPACGTGTFLVEALVQRLADLKSKGGINDKSVAQVISRLHGLDISPFAVALAQIQVFWHLVEMMSDKTTQEAREFARAILPVIRLHGGWSSLDPMGLSFGNTSTASAQEGLAFRVRREEGRAVGSLIPAGFERVTKEAFDLVIMNPPYVRSERQGATDYSRTYSEVSHRGTDLSAFFVYRALRQWVKPGGTLAFIVPIGLMEAEYGGPLRRVLREYKIKLIADLEGLGRTTFRGIKRPTVIVVVEKTAPSTDDDVEMLQLDESCITDEDVIDFAKAQRSLVKRSDLERSRYLPDDATMAPWIGAIRAGGDDAGAILTKMVEGDVPTLAATRNLPRLGSLVKVVWVKRGREGLQIADEVPTGATRVLWKPELVFNYGVKLGGAKALAAPSDPAALDLYKGQNIFPAGVLGQPMGRWNPDAGKEDNPYIYTYRQFLSQPGTFALREISQLPTASPITGQIAFQNTVFVCQLTEPFPMNVYLLSRVVQFFAARVLRSSIIEDYGCHWYKRTIPFLPVPADRSQANLDRLAMNGEEVLQADADLADRYRHIRQLMSEGSGRTLNDLLADGDALVHGLDLTGVSESPVPITEVNEAGADITVPDLFFQLRVPDERLRVYVAFALRRMLEDDPDLRVSRTDIVGLLVPEKLDEVVEAIRQLETSDATARYAKSLASLDTTVAELLGLTDEQRDYAVKKMTTDPVLRRMRPMLAHRGLRVQPYADHSAGDRYE
ncbi:MAG: SAM-dependent DNA methyltransferase [Mesorhizobium sp.]|uniref:HsdM family class I SAM-dependent methyltransferase n=1 Tax=Mesorhizobium sp. TaxID=1871066 RepID=UPI000FE67BAA|nr:N-6 DNA methylase [Mesorhizobium sp.]RWH94136.1 MAG: SAM-dependent DNA methyltransferase [Mesorhizobium sp.]RWK82765.1 MAG: SAM-dependent DNA methyltransferase [Mesorhizobium sp.]RWL06573.1 MAG: SAM-dependent DNA methyltransferase [Mesorhizobium sp.]